MSHAKVTILPPFFKLLAISRAPQTFIPVEPPQNKPSSLERVLHILKASSWSIHLISFKAFLSKKGGSNPTASPVKTDTKVESGGTVSAPKADTTPYGNRGGKGKVDPKPAPKPDLNDGAANKTSPVAKG